jgi:hypothetical protein
MLDTEEARDDATVGEGVYVKSLLLAPKNNLMLQITNLHLMIQSTNVILEPETR